MSNSSTRFRMWSVLQHLSIAESTESYPSQPTTSASRAGLPKVEWSHWEYKFSHCTESVHTDQAEANKLLKWLQSKPYMNASAPFLYDRDGTMRMGLALGMLHHDLFTAQMGMQDPDDEPDPSIPEWVGESLIEFSAIETHILPLCRQMTAAIRAGPAPPRHSARKPVKAISKEIKGSALPAVPEEASGSKKPVGPKRGRAASDESAGRADKKVPKRPRA